MATGLPKLHLRLKLSDINLFGNDAADLEQEELFSHTPWLEQNSPILWTASEQFRLCALIKAREIGASSNCKEAFKFGES